MTASPASPAPPWTIQLDLRRRIAYATIARVAEHAGAGRIAMAEDVLRGSSLAALMNVAHELEAAVAIATADRPDVTIVDPEHPTLLIALALGRIQVSGRATGMASALRSVGLRLRRSTGGDPIARARDLSLAALAFYIARRPDEALHAGRRGAELLLSLGDETLLENVELVGATAGDLAAVLFPLSEFVAATDMWELIRRITADPRSLPLQQADWGLSTIGVVGGGITMVSPAAKGVFALPDAPPGSVQQIDPWLAMVYVARAWTRLDQLDAAGALEASRRGLGVVGDASMMGPLVFVHTIALLANGRTASASAFLRELTAAGHHMAADSGLARWFLFCRAVVAAIGGYSDDARAYALAIPDDSPIARLARAFVALCEGDAHTAADLLTAGGDLVPRMASFEDTMRAAVEARLGNTTAARAALHRAVGTADTHGVRTWALLLPEPDLAALHEVAREGGHPSIAELLPEHSNVDAPIRRMPLSAREAEILQLVARGHTNPEIAAHLFISRNTVKFHLAKLFRRLGVSTRAEAAAIGATMADRSGG